MIGRRAIAIFVIVFFSIIKLFGQVQSKAYDLMIRSLISHTVPEISVDSLKKNYSKVVLLDAREPNEYLVSHMKGSINVGYDKFSINEVKNISKEDTIVVYCSVGYRSEKVGEKLKQAGYKNVYNLYGGIFEWKNRFNLVYNDVGETEDIHAYGMAWGIWLSNGHKVYTK
jgi:rhodanese-related sulfurtransferase